MNFDPENPCPESDVSRFFQLETTHMPPYGYAHNPDTALNRSNACGVFKLFGYICKCHPSVTFLAISYYDSFISTRDIPVLIADDDVINRGLFVASCFCLAWKMMYPDEYDIPAFLIILGLCYTTHDIDAMEHEIDRCLEQRSCKRPITSLAFLDFFLSSHLDYVNEPYLTLIRNFATHRAYAQQFNIEYTEYRPSVLAATAILHSCGIFYDGYCNTFVASFFRSYYLDGSCLAQALKLQSPHVNIEPETLKKSLRLQWDRRSNDSKSSSSSPDHRPASHDNVSTTDTSSQYPELQPQFNERSPSTVLPDNSQFHDAGSVDKGPLSRCPQCSELIEGIADESGLYPLLQPPTDASPSYSPFCPLFDDIEPIDDVASAFSCTRTPRVDAPKDALPQHSGLHDYEPIETDEAIASSFFPLCRDNEPSDAAFSLSTCGSSFHEGKHFEAPSTLANQDSGPEDSSIQNANTSSTADPTPPRFSESISSSVSYMASVDQAAAAAEYRSSWFGNATPFGAICRPEKRRCSI